MASLKCIEQRLCEILQELKGGVSVTPGDQWQSLFETAIDNALTSQLEDILQAALEAADITVNAIQSGTWTVDVGSIPDVVVDPQSIADLVSAIEEGGPYDVTIDGGTLTVTLDQDSLDALENITVTVDTSAGPVEVTGTVTIDQSGGPLQVEVTDLPDVTIDSGSIKEIAVAIADQTLNVEIDQATIDQLIADDDTDDDLRPVNIGCYCWTDTDGNKGAFSGYGTAAEDGSFAGWQVVGGTPAPAGASVNCCTAELLQQVIGDPSDDCPCDGESIACVSVSDAFLSGSNIAVGDCGPGDWATVKTCLEDAGCTVTETPTTLAGPPSIDGLSDPFSTPETIGSTTVNATGVTGTRVVDGVTYLRLNDQPGGATNQATWTFDAPKTNVCLEFFDLETNEDIFITASNGGTPIPFDPAWIEVIPPEIDFTAPNQFTGTTFTSTPDADPERSFRVCIPGPVDEVVTEYRVRNSSNSGRNVLMSAITFDDQVEASGTQIQVECPDGNTPTEITDGTDTVSFADC